jgi:FlaA1/EpsC-like NDP-sugar epimerase
MRLLWHSLSLRSGVRRGVVLGTGGAAAIVVLVLQQNHSLNTNPVAVIDTDPASDRLRIHGVAVHYVGENGVDLVRRTGADLLIVPASIRLSPNERSIVEQCRDAGISIEQFDVGLHHWQDEAVTA